MKRNKIREIAKPDFKLIWILNISKIWKKKDFRLCQEILTIKDPAQQI